LDPAPFALADAAGAGCAGSVCADAIAVAPNNEATTRAEIASLERMEFLLIRISDAGGKTGEPNECSLSESRIFPRAHKQGPHLEVWALKRGECSADKESNGAIGKSLLSRSRETRLIPPRFSGINFLLGTQIGTSVSTHTWSQVPNIAVFSYPVGGQYNGN
jgi:hypothetical protein